MKKIICLLLIFPFFLVFASKEEDAIKERLKPVGSVCIQGQDCSTQTSPSSDSTSQVALRSGKEVYEGACMTCHSIGLAGAPKFGDKLSWGGREDKDIESLASSVMDGLNGMPRMGLCMNCSQEEITSAVDYMLSELN
jgi:cytochrome c5